MGMLSPVINVTDDFLMDFFGWVKKDSCDADSFLKMESQKRSFGVCLGYSFLSNPSNIFGDQCEVHPWKSNAEPFKHLQTPLWTVNHSNTIW